MDQILETVRGFDGILELAPQAGSDYPEIAWGDHFFYCSPDGRVPQSEQPYATIVTKNYPGDESSDLDSPGRRRLNVHVGKRRFAELLGADPKNADLAAVDFSAADTVIPHPVYARLGWIAIVDPGPRTSETALALLRGVHEDARRRAERRRTAASADGGDSGAGR